MSAATMAEKRRFARSVYIPYIGALVITIGAMIVGKLGSTPAYSWTADLSHLEAYSELAMGGVFGLIVLVLALPILTVTVFSTKR